MLSGCGLRSAMLPEVSARGSRLTVSVQPKLYMLPGTGRCDDAALALPRASCTWWELIPRGRASEEGGAADSARSASPSQRAWTSAPLSCGVL